MPLYQIIALGCIGGILPDVLSIVKARHGSPPAYLRNKFFWISLTILGILGGGAAALAGPTKIIEALSIGYSAPAIISKALSIDNNHIIMFDFNSVSTPMFMTNDIIDPDFEEPGDISHFYSNRYPIIKPRPLSILAMITGLRKWWRSL